MTEGDVEHLKRALRVERLRLVVGDVGRRQFDAVFLQEVAGEVAMLRRDPRLQAFQVTSFSPAVEMFSGISTSSP
jgi:hypothetical protein